ncbi:MAG: hypothetical protein COA78_30555 [Blastopirellula sp.]|nr:MAG: hypothetical protein COA78_30555 [Blastopirellula sp.]
MGRLFRSFFYLITFQIDKAGEAMMKNPGVMSASYDKVIQDKTNNVRKYKDAIGGMRTQQKKKEAQLKRLVESTDERTPGIELLSKLCAGAKVAAAKIAQERHGGDPEKFQADMEWQKCYKAWKDFSSTLREKQKRAEEIEDRISEYDKGIEGHKLNIKGLLRDLEGIKHEKHDAVADMISSTEEKELADMMSGIQTDGANAELQRLRDVRTKAKADAEISTELSGLDAANDVREFLQFAENEAADDEFLSAMKSTDTKSIESMEKDRDFNVPE